MNCMCCGNLDFSQWWIIKKNIAKGTTDPRVEFISQILIKFQFQNLNLALTSKSQPNISISTKRKLKILTKPSLRILTKIQLCNLNQTSAAKYWPNFRFKISPALEHQNIDQTLCWKSEQKLSFMTKPQLLNLQQTVANTILITNISNSNNLNKFRVGILTCQGHINQVCRTGVSEWVS